jgi:hypothetical protein
MPWRYAQDCNCAGCSNCSRHAVGEDDRPDSRASDVGGAGPETAVTIGHASGPIEGKSALGKLPPRANAHRGRLRGILCQGMATRKA